MGIKIPFDDFCGNRWTAGFLKLDTPCVTAKQAPVAVAVPSLGVEHRWHGGRLWQSQPTRNLEDEVASLLEWGEPRGIREDTAKSRSRERPAGTPIDMTGRPSAEQALWMARECLLVVDGVLHLPSPGPCFFLRTDAENPLQFNAELQVGHTGWLRRAGEMVTLVRIDRAPEAIEALAGSLSHLVERARKSAVEVPVVEIKIPEALESVDDVAISANLLGEQLMEQLADMPVARNTVETLTDGLALRRVFAMRRGRDPFDAGKMKRCNVDIYDRRGLDAIEEVLARAAGAGYRESLKGHLPDALRVHAARHAIAPIPQEDARFLEEISHGL